MERYEGDYFHRLRVDRSDKITKTVKLTQEELQLLEKMYPGKSFSYAVRSLIYNQTTSNTKNQE